VSLTITPQVWGASLAWDSNTDPVDGYRVYYGTNQSALTLAEDVGTATTYNLDKLKLSENVQYYFSVTAYNETGESPRTAPLSFIPADKTPPRPPVDLVAVPPN
jgi:hypothetical protein